MNNSTIDRLKDLAKRLSEDYSEEAAEQFARELAGIPKAAYEDLYFAGNAGGETVCVSHIRLSMNKVFYDVKPVGKTEGTVRSFSMTDFPGFSACVASAVAESAAVFKMKRDEEKALLRRNGRKARLMEEYEKNR